MTDREEPTDLATPVDPATRLRVTQAVAAAANEALHLEDAFERALTEVCECLGWDVGHAFIPGGEGIETTSLWYDAEPDASEAFRAASAAVRFEAGEGHPGRVLRLRSPVWIPDLESDDFVRRDAALRSGLRSGAAFPVMTGDDVVGVLELYIRRPRVPDEAMLDTMGFIGIQLGRVVERLRSTRALERAAAERTAFLSTVSHELSTPLTSVVGFASMLESRWDQMSDDDRRTAIRAIARQSQRLQRLVKDLLVVSRLDASAVEVAPERVEVAAAVAQAIDDVWPDDRPDPEARVAAGLSATVDPDHLQQILVNLLSNADRYGEPPVRIAATGDGSTVTITVADEGPGVNEAFVPRLFERFAQGTEGASKTGSGLGLSIVRSLARLNGGDAVYAPNEPSGARFIVMLPA
jgi:signal transduction histidine kinase